MTKISAKMTAPAPKRACAEHMHADKPNDCSSSGNAHWDNQGMVKLPLYTQCPLRRQASTTSSSYVQRPASQVNPRLPQAALSSSLYQDDARSLNSADTTASTILPMMLLHCFTALRMVSPDWAQRLGRYPDQPPAVQLAAAAFAGPCCLAPEELR